MMRHGEHSALPDPCSPRELHSRAAGLPSGCDSPEPGRTTWIAHPRPGNSGLLPDTGCTLRPLCDLQWLLLAEASSLKLK